MQTCVTSTVQVCLMRESQVMGHFVPGYSQNCGKEREKVGYLLSLMEDSGKDDIF